MNGLQLVSDIENKVVPAVGHTTFRPPYTPISIGAIVGREVGKHSKPTRKSPMHSWHEKNNAVFVDAGVWLRPRYYKQGNETLFEASKREAKNVRTNVGVCDVTTLGKIDIKGPDAAELLNRVYTNAWLKLPVGKARYGVMLREDGIVMDDGTTTRISENHYHMTTTTAQAVVIIGGGGHGLATAYYLAKEHNITKVAIIEKGWIGGGNVGRNTTIIRSNYMHDENALFSEFGMDLWRKMSQDLNYNVMFSPRGIINLAHSDAQMNAYARRGNSMRLNGIDAVLLNREQVKEIIPMADFSENVRFPIFGGLMQPSAGTARHDAVAWGYARQADSMGVDIIQNCEVTGFDVTAGKINGIRTSRGNIKTKKVGLCVAGSTD